MKTIALWACAVLAAAACAKTSGDKNKNEDKGSTTATDVPAKHRPRGPQVPPPDGVGTIPADADKTPMGVAYRKKARKGESTERPGPNDTVTLSYTSWKPDGATLFTNVGKRPQKMSLSTTGPGWREVMQLMTVGETWVVFMTPQLAFGDKAARAPKEIQTYEVELIEIERAPAVPDDVAAVPADATRTDSGLAYKLLAKGKPGPKPRYYDEVEFHFTGWTTDGLMVDSSVVRHRPRKSVLFREMDGWNQGIQTMTIGEKKRFWVPEPLTRTSKWTPQGMLVYDIELLAVTRNQKPWPTPADVAAPPTNAEKTRSGIAYVVLQKGSGDKHPADGDMVEVNYSGWTTDGRLFDTSVLDGKPATIPVGRVIPGWNEAMMRMVTGEKTRFWIPDHLGYKGRPGPQGTLVFDIELVAIKEKPRPPPTPADVAAPPADAKKTADGVFYKVLTPGTGKVHPKPTDNVIAHYTGWTTDGKMFDTSVTKARPSTFGLDGVIKGWTSGIQTMVVGQKNRFWIPAELAYKDKPRRPQGMLVFDVELLAIK